MAQLVDWEKLSRLFLERGERVVLVPPQGEPLVLVPLTQYEGLVKGPKAANVPPKPKPIVKRTQNQTPLELPNTAGPLEPIDPPQGALPDDDQYFPEPL